MTFDSKLTFEKNLRPVSRAASQTLDIFIKSWRVSMTDRFLGDAFGVLSCRFGVLFCSVVLGCRYYVKLLDHAVSGAWFLAGGAFECDIAYRRSVAALYMLYKIRCNLVHPLYNALSEPYVPVRVTRVALFAHRYTYVPPRCRTSQ